MHPGGNHLSMNVPCIWSIILFALPPLSFTVHSQFRASRNRSATDLLKPVVNKTISGCVRSPCTCLFWQVRNGLSTGLLQAVVTELQQCCFQRACRELLWQSCSDAVFNRPVATCWHRAAAMLFSTTCDRPVANRGKRFMKLRVSTILNKSRPKTGFHISVVVFRKITRLILITNLRDKFWAKQPKKNDKERLFIVNNFQN
jgi:hypothetical protein